MRNPSKGSGKTGLLDHGLSPEIKQAISRDMKAGRVFTIKDIQTLMRCSYETAHKIVSEEPGVIWFVPHTVFRKMCRHLKQTGRTIARLAPVCVISMLDVGLV